MGNTIVGSVIMIVSYFRTFSKKCPRLINATANVIGFAGCNAFAWHLTQRIKDVDERRIAEDNFLDAEECKAALARHRNQSTMDKPSANKPK